MPQILQPPSPNAIREQLKKLVVADLAGPAGGPEDEVAEPRVKDRYLVGKKGVKKLEKRTDIYASTLRAVIEAMGGTLEIVARFPDGSVKITTFSSIGEDETAT